MFQKPLAEKSKRFAVYAKITLSVGDVISPYTRASEHATMEEAEQAAAALEREHYSMWVFAGVNDGPTVK